MEKQEAAWSETKGEEEAEKDKTGNMSGRGRKGKRSAAIVLV